MSSIAVPVGRTRTVAVVLAIAAVFTAQRASMQTPAPPSWAGWARCQVDVQGPGYVERQVHTWISNGGAPTVEGAFRVYPGTWSMVGGGSLQRTQGTQTLMAQWAINGASASAPLAVFVRASDGRMLIQARHAQLRAAGAVAGYQQQIIDGAPQSPGQIAGEGFEWSFPVIGAPAADKAVSGSSAPAVNGSVGYMQPGGSRGTASCQWTFGQGTAAPAPPPALAAVPVPSAPASVNAAGPAVPAQPAQAPPAAGGAGQVPPSVAIALPPGIPTLVVPSQPAVVAVPAAIPTAISPPVATALEAAIPSATAKPPATRAEPSRQFTEAVFPVVPECTLRGPDRSPSSANFYTPTYAYLRWTAVAGATSYEVSRRDLGLIKTIDATGGMALTHGTLFVPGTIYEYAIKAIYPTGCGVSLVNASAFPASPLVTFTLGPGAGEVRLAWHVEKGDVNVAHIEGPGLPAAGVDSSNSDYRGAGVKQSHGSLRIVGVPKGSQTWTVTLLWGSGPDAIKSTAKPVTAAVP